MKNVSIRIAAEICKGCALCVAACRRGVLSMSKAFNSRGYHVPRVDKPADCTGCRQCADICPDAAIELGRVGGPNRDVETAADRGKDRA